MKKIYIIRYEDLNDEQYSSGVSYAFDTLEKAKIMLEQIKQDEICSSDIEDIKNNVIDNINGFVIDYIDDYTKFVIEEMEVL